MYDSADTIAAIATAPGRASLAVIRLSGPATRAVLARTFRRPGREPLIARKLAYGHVIDPSTGATLDEAMAVFLPAPHTYTREPMGEIHCHGGAAAPRAVLRACLAAGARLAEPGELTLRAFVHGRLDLARAEAVLDVVHAQTDAQLRLALDGVNGRLSDAVRALRGRILDLLAHVSATIDFPEDDVPGVTLDDPLLALVADLIRLRAQARVGVIRREGARVAIVGRPNVGKSSLFNALLGSGRAIVTDVPGTTRDTLEESVDLDGILVTLIDTAGQRRTDDPVEEAGIERARIATARADLILIVVDQSEPLTPADWVLLGPGAGRPTILALNKSDLPARAERPAIGTAIEISAIRGDGIDALRGLLRQKLAGDGTSADDAIPANVRQEAALGQATDALTHALRARHADAAAAALASAMDELGTITGETADDELLNTIFSRFCIGK